MAEEAPSAPSAEECRAEAARILCGAENHADPERQHAVVRIAETWIALAELPGGPDGPGDAFGLRR